MSVQPTVTVLMAAYNAKEYIDTAIHSVLSQAYRDFELLVVNDASTDETSEILEVYAKRDARVRIINNEKNLGLASSLNIGLEHAKGRYIARMDADDISLDSRLTAQVSFLESNLNVDIVGSWIDVYDSAMEEYQYTWKTPPADTIIKTRNLFAPSVAHPSVMLRKSSLDRCLLRYDSSLRHSEDYWFWIECGKFLQYANIQKSLLLYRDNAEGMTKSKKNIDLRKGSLEIIHRRILSDLGLAVTDDRLRLMYELNMTERMVCSLTNLVSYISLGFKVLTAARIHSRISITYGIYYICGKFVKKLLKYS